MADHDREQKHKLPEATVAAPESTMVQHAKTAKPTKAQESDETDARVQVARDAFARNSPANKKPQPQPNLYRVSYGNRTQDVEALDENEAWARFCDQQQAWPSPRTGRTVELLSRDSR